MYDRKGHCPTLPHDAWMHRKGTDALLSAIENADGDSVELSMVPDRVSEAERIDREMEQRGGLLRAIYLDPEIHRAAEAEADEFIRRLNVKTSKELWVPALLSLAILALALLINATMGGGQ